METSIPVLYEDRHILVANKPPGLVCHEDEIHTFSLRSVLQQRIAKQRTTATAFLTPAHRLDRGTSGAIVLAKTSKALSRLTKSLSSKENTQKSYHCLVIARPDALNKTSEGEWKDLWEDYLVKKDHYAAVVSGPNSLSKHTEVAKKALSQVTGLTQSKISHLKQMLPGDIPVSGALSQKAKSKLYHCIEEAVSQGRLVKLQVDIETGRYHQIRVQAASRGFWILGDWRYFTLFLNSSTWAKKLFAPFCAQLKASSSCASTNTDQLYPELAPLYSKPFYLHAKTLRFPHPVPSRIEEDHHLIKSFAHADYELGSITTVAPYPEDDLALWRLFR